MKERIWRKDGMKQIIDSGWKEFDRQTNCITTGNAYCNTQMSSFIRPWKETECNGNMYSEGSLLGYDLKQYSRFQVPKPINEILKDKKREDSVILYMFFVINKDKGNRIEPFCWVVTDRDHKLIMYRIITGYGKCTTKRISAAHEAISYITEEG